MVLVTGVAHLPRSRGLAMCFLSTKLASWNIKAWDRLRPGWPGKIPYGPHGLAIWALTGVRGELSLKRSKPKKLSEDW